MTGYCLHRVKEQIREKAIEFNQNPSGNQHPTSSNNWRGRQILQKILHCSALHIKKIIGD